MSLTIDTVAFICVMDSLSRVGTRLHRKWDVTNSEVARLSYAIHDSSAGEYASKSTIFLSRTQAEFSPIRAIAFKAILSCQEDPWDSAHARCVCHFQVPDIASFVTGPTCSVLMELIFVRNNHTPAAVTPLDSDQQFFLHFSLFLN